MGSEETFEKLKKQSEFFSKLSKYVREEINPYSNEGAEHVLNCLNACFSVTAMVAVGMRGRPEQGSSYWIEKLAEVRGATDLLSIFQGQVKALLNFVRQHKRMQSRALKFSRDDMLLNDVEVGKLSTLKLKSAYIDLKFKDEVDSIENLDALQVTLQGLDDLVNDKIKLMIRAGFDLREDPKRNPNEGRFPDPTKGYPIERDVSMKESGSVGEITLEEGDITV